jgi:hypothetical protein
VPVPVPVPVPVLEDVKKDVQVTQYSV